jgi:hypothetical protein
VSAGDIDPSRATVHRRGGGRASSVPRGQPGRREGFISPIGSTPFGHFELPFNGTNLEAHVDGFDPNSAQAYNVTIPGRIRYLLQNARDAQGEPIHVEQWSIAPPRDVAQGRARPAIERTAYSFFSPQRLFKNDGVGVTDDSFDQAIFQRWFDDDRAFLADLVVPGPFDAGPLPGPTCPLRQ